MGKPNLLIPMAGKGQRFVDEGYFMPKPLIMAGDRHIIDWAFGSIDLDEYNLIFVVREDHCNSHNIDKILLNKFGANINIIKVKDTDGTVSSCLKAINKIDNDSPLVIYTLDVNFKPSFYIKEINGEIDGLILTFKSNNPSYSYISINKDGRVIQTAEKSVISENAAVGIYFFKKGKLFIKAAREMIAKNHKVNGEFYLCPVYNYLTHKKIYTKQVDKMYLMGTPSELNFFTKNIIPQFGNKPIALCSDHSGFLMKEMIKEVLENKNINYIDFGTYTNKDCDYIDYIKQATKHIEDGICDFGISSCRSGQGVNIAANKQRGIRSAIIYNEEMAKLSIEHNCANFFSFPSGYLAVKSLPNIINYLINSTFDGGRHLDRLRKLEK